MLDIIPERKRKSRRGRNNGTTKQPENKMATINPYLSIITLNVD